MKLNLGCGSDRRPGYLNVDLYPPHDVKVDLSTFPWPWESSSINEILMYDFLEHFPYAQTDRILAECWRVLKPDGTLEIQVPDLEHCARAAVGIRPFLCNRCGYKFEYGDLRANFFICGKCNQPERLVAEAAVKRLYGGQDRPGNFHYTAFTFRSLKKKLQTMGFNDFRVLEEAHQHANWNMKMRCQKSLDNWDWCEVEG